jgi:type II secretory pathway pseudopilin PulG
MKKLLSLIAIMIIAIGVSAQIKVIQIAKGAAGVDSLNGAQTKYYYLKLNGAFTTAASYPMNEYYLYAFGATTTRSTTVTGTDSCQITFEVSHDNTNWVKFTGTTPKTIGGGVYTILPDMVTTTTNGGAVFQPTSCYYPYVRVKFQHYKASCTMFPQCWVILKKY